MAIYIFRGVRKIAKRDRELLEQLGPCWTRFREIRYFSIFRKSVEKIQVSLKSAVHMCICR